MNIKKTPTIIIPILKTVGVLKRIEIKIPIDMKESPKNITNKVAGSMMLVILEDKSKSDV